METNERNDAFTQYIAGFIGLMVLVIIVMNAVLPSVTTAIADANLTGANLALANLIPLLVIVVIVLLVLGMAQI